MHGRLRGDVDIPVPLSPEAGIRIHMDCRCRALDNVFAERLPRNIYEDETDNKLLHIAGIWSSNGQSETNRDIPVALRNENGMTGEASAEARLL